MPWPSRSREPDAELLSTRLTLVQKLVLPPAWMAFFGVGAVVLLLRPEQTDRRALAFAVALFIGAFTFWNWALPLKRVAATRRGLLVSNFRREVLVPWDEIAAVGTNRMVNTVTVELSRPCALGSRIVFRPRAARAAGGEHPAAALVRERATAARRG